MDIDYYDPTHLQINTSNVWYRFYRLLLTKEGTSERWTHVDNTFLYKHFSDPYNPTQNEIVLFELIFGEGTVKKIYERIQ